MSSNVWPPVHKKLSEPQLSGTSDSMVRVTRLLPPIFIQDGFVPHSNPCIFFPPIMTFGRGC